MTEKRVSVRLAAVGGRQVRAELEGVGEAGSRGFGRLSREMDAANQRLAAFSRRATIAVTAAAAGFAAGAAAMVRLGLQAVDAQAKLAHPLGRPWRASRRWNARANSPASPCPASSMRPRI